MPYAYPTPAAAGVPGSEGTTDKPVVAQSMAAANIPNLSGSAALPPKVSLFGDCCFRSPRAVLAWDCDSQTTFYVSGSSGAPSSKGESSQ